MIVSWGITPDNAWSLPHIGKRVNGNCGEFHRNNRLWRSQIPLVLRDVFQIAADPQSSHPNHSQIAISNIKAPESRCIIGDTSVLEPPRRARSEDTGGIPSRDYVARKTT
jgi:hypothetical protein